MYTFIIESIKKTKCWINGIRTHLVCPTPELFQRRTSSISFKGWVASLNEEIDDICLSCMGIRIVSAQIIPRVDVQQAYPESKNVAGFELDIVPVVFGQDEPLQVVLTTKDGRSSPLFEIYLRFDEGKVQREVTASKLPTFALIVSGGRCGSTLLAQLLLRSKVVLGYNEYPYEAHIASRLSMKWLSELQPAHYRSMSNSGESSDQGLSAIHSMLVNYAGDIQHIDPMKALIEQSRQQTCEHITQLYKILSPQKDASVIVEKFDTELSFWLMRDVFPDFRPVFLIRDPRDAILSVRSFNEKRGNYRFHEADILKPLDQILFFAASLMRIAEYYDHFDGDRILIKYEDLVRTPTQVMRQVFDYLGIDHSPQEIAKFVSEIPSQNDHVTSSSPEESIGRWKQELSGSQKEAVNWILQPFISRFGY
jgi:Sulfotransferase family